MSLANLLKRPPIDSKTLKAAQAMVEMEQSEGWKAFKEAVESLIQSNTPNISEFGKGDAESIASRVVYVSALKRCLGLIEQQKEILKTGKKPE